MYVAASLGESRTFGELFDILGQWIEAPAVRFLLCRKAKAGIPPEATGPELRSGQRSEPSGKRPGRGKGAATSTSGSANAGAGAKGKAKAKRGGKAGSGLGANGKRQIYFEGAVEILLAAIADAGATGDADRRGEASTSSSTTIGNNTSGVSGNMNGGTDGAGNGAANSNNNSSSNSNSGRKFDPVLLHAGRLALGELHRAERIANRTDLIMPHFLTTSSKVSLPVNQSISRSFSQRQYTRVQPHQT